MHSFVLLLACALLLSAQERFYVADSGESKITVVDGVTNRVAGEVPVSAAPQAVAVSIDGRRLFVSSEGKNAVDVVDRLTGKLVRSIPVGRRPGDLLRGPGGPQAIRSGAGHGGGGGDRYRYAGEREEYFYRQRAGWAGCYARPDPHGGGVRQGDHKLSVSQHPDRRGRVRNPG